MWKMSIDPQTNAYIVWNLTALMHCSPLGSGIFSNLTHAFQLRRLSFEASDQTDIPMNRRIRCYLWTRFCGWAVGGVGGPGGGLGCWRPANCQRQLRQGNETARNAGRSSGGNCAALWTNNARHLKWNGSQSVGRQEARLTADGQVGVALRKCHYVTAYN